MTFKTWTDVSCWVWEPKTIFGTEPNTKRRKIWEKWQVTGAHLCSFPICFTTRTPSQNKHTSLGVDLSAERGTNTLNVRRNDVNANVYLWGRNIQIHVSYSQDNKLRPRQAAHDWTSEGRVRSPFILEMRSWEIRPILIVGLSVAGHQQPHQSLYPGQSSIARRLEGRQSEAEFDFSFIWEEMWKARKETKSRTTS